MKRHLSPVVPALLGLLAWGALPTGPLCADDSRAGNQFHTEPGPLSRQQIEADWLRQDELRTLPAGGVARGASNVTCRADAAGGVDGVKNGKWGFHTQNEPNPWWQVDLQKRTPIDRVLLYNRCDLPDRIGRMMLLLSDDGKMFKRVWQNDGTIFYGFTDKKPLEVRLHGVQARFVRLQLPLTSYFHLDEVEIYPVGEGRNIALGKPADQSSVSEWSTKHDAPVPPEVRPQNYALGTVLARGRKLAEAIRALGARSDADVRVLDQVALQAKRLPKDAPGSVRRDLYMQARWAVRRMVLANPLLNFDSVLFVKRAPGILPHMSDQYYGWWSRPGGGIFVLEHFKSAAPRVRCLTAGMPEGSFLNPDLSYDGKRVLFAYCTYYPSVAGMANKVDKQKLPEDSFYNIYEMNIDGTGRRRVTRGRYDDFDPHYLPNGEIVFLSTRKGTSIQCSRASAAATEDAVCPDSYVRCGGDAYRPVAVFTLHVMDAGGKNLRPISAFENFEWTPSVAWDGRILYARWDYIDRFNGPFISLWSTNPDGTGAQLIYKQFTTRPQCAFEARSIPNSQKLIFTACGHHSIDGGSLVLLDRTRGTEESQPITRLTPEVAFPETESYGDTYYESPWPLSEQFYLVAWSDKRLPPHCVVTDDRNPANACGIYLYDAFGNLEPLYRDPAISSQFPIPVAPRAKPAVLRSATAWDGVQEGRFMVQDVYRGLEGVRRGTAKKLRIIAVPPKVQPNMNSPVLGISAEDPGKFVLGTVPVEADGSAHFRVPSGLPVFFQVLDEKGLAIQTMRTLTYVQAEQTQSCIGCHEHRDMAPPYGKPPLAAMKEPSKLTPGPAGSWPLRYDQLVQPVLDRSCVSCHDPKSTRAKAARLDLTPAKSYQSLLTFGGEDLKKLAFERDRSVPGRCTAMKSKLYALLSDEKGHEGIHLDADGLDRLTLWMDVYAQRSGSFSEPQEQELRKLRQRWAHLLTAGTK
ncbi:MAG: discoidin domain-containing protein [Thermoguttaceae bacterium]